MNRLSGVRLVFIVSFVIMASHGSAAELAKEGSGAYRSGRSATVEVMKLGKDRLQINYDETGVVVDAPEDSPFHNASFRTMGTIHVDQGMLTYNGAALWTRPNGDEIYGLFTGSGKRGAETNGSLTIVGGTGECAGIEGTLKLKSGPPVKPSKAGTAQGTTVGEIHWRIP